MHWLFCYSERKIVLYNHLFFNQSFLKLLIADTSRLTSASVIQFIPQPMLVFPK